MISTWSVHGDIPRGSPNIRVARARDTNHSSRHALRPTQSRLSISQAHHEFLTLSAVHSRHGVWCSLFTFFNPQPFSWRGELDDLTTGSFAMHPPEVSSPGRSLVPLKDLRTSTPLHSLAKHGTTPESSNPVTPASRQCRSLNHRYGNLCLFLLHALRTQGPARERMRGCSG